MFSFKEEDPLDDARQPFSKYVENFPLLSGGLRLSTPSRKRMVTKISHTGLRRIVRGTAAAALAFALLHSGALVHAAGPGPASAGEQLLPAGELMDGSQRNYDKFSIAWPEGYFMRSNGRKEDDRTIYSVGLETDSFLAIMRVDTMPIGGFANLLSDEKVYDIAAGRVRDTMRKDFPDLELGGKETRTLNGAKFYGRKLKGNYKRGGAQAEGKLLLNKKDGLLYIITVMEVSEKPGAHLKPLLASLDTFRFNTAKTAATE